LLLSLPPVAGGTPENADLPRALRAIKTKPLIMTGVQAPLNPEWEPLAAARYIRDVRTTTIKRS